MNENLRTGHKKTHVDSVIINLNKEKGTHLIKDERYEIIPEINGMSGENRKKKHLSMNKPK